MRSLLVLGMLVSALVLSGCCVKRSNCCVVRSTPSMSTAATTATAASVARTDATEITYVSKDAPEQRRSYPAPPPPSLPAGITAEEAGNCAPCKPACNPFQAIFCNPCCGPGG